MQVTYNVLTPNIKHPYKLICLSESMLHLVLKGLNEEVTYKRGLGRPDMKLFTQEANMAARTPVHNQALGVHAWRRAPTNLALGMPEERGCKINDT